MALLLKVFILFATLFFTNKAHAIVLLPVVFLVPLVKLLAIILGAFSIPVLSGSVLLAYLTKNYKRVLLVSILILTLIGIVSAVVLRVLHPENPWF